MRILGDLNDGITSTFGVSGKNDNGSRLVEFCAERGLCVGNTYFEHMSLNKYTKVARGQDGVEVKGMINLVLVKKDMLRYVKDVRTMKGMRRDLANHYVVLREVRLVGAWIKMREVVVEDRRIRSKKLREHMLGLLRRRELNGMETIMSNTCGNR